MTIGYLLVGHGTRNAEGRAEFLQLAESIADRMPAQLVRSAFLELAEPTISAAIAQLRQAGAREIVCAPIILLAAAHVKQDIPAAVRDAARAGGIDKVRFAEHLGCRDAMLQLSAQRFREAAADSASSQSLGWVLVGRGTRDEAALAEIRRFMELRGAIVPTSSHWLGFLAMAEPTLEEALESAARSAAGTIIVQPHLLFQGDLLGRTASVVEAFTLRYPQKRWILAKHLGPHGLIAASVSSELMQMATV